MQQIATLLEEQGVAFKPAAYRRGAQVIRELPKDTAEYGDAKELQKLPGIGEAIAGKIIEFQETGTLSLLERLRAEQGGISADLLDIEGLGPKRVRQLQMELDIRTVDDLVKAAEAGKLRSLPRFSDDLEQKVLENARRVHERVRRFSRAEVQPEVEKLITTIRDVSGVERAEVAGSYRREKETVGDIDVLVITKRPQKISDAIAALSIVRNVVAHGDKKLSFDLQSGIRVDVRFVKRNEWGSALLYFTGSKEHNITMRKKAITKGWKLNEYGLFEGEKIIAQKEEVDIYAALEMPYCEPRERTK